MIGKVVNYVGTDGLLHILCSAILVGLIDFFFPLYVAIIATFAIGVFKELVWDKWLGRGTFAWKDLLCDLLGILIGCL